MQNQITDELGTSPRMEPSLLIYAVLVASACNRVAEAAVTAWTSPKLAGKDGTGAATGKAAESTGAGITLAATASGTITYAITTQDAGTPTVTWVIDASTGVITKSLGALSYASKSTYVIVATAADGASTGTATVTININKPPGFSGQIAATIPDGSTAGTALITLTPINTDSDTMTYALTDTSFQISATTGAITVKTGVTLASATLAGYTLHPTAADGYDTATATIWVAVKTCSSAAAGVTTSLVLVLSAIFTMLKLYLD